MTSFLANFAASTSMGKGLMKQQIETLVNTSHEIEIRSIMSQLNNNNFSKFEPPGIKLSDATKKTAKEMFFAAAANKGITIDSPTESMNSGPSLAMIREIVEESIEAALTKRGLTIDAINTTIDNKISEAFQQKGITGGKGTRRKRNYRKKSYSKI
jgi:hypothetical protein